jgi:hypothetical protein
MKYVVFTMHELCAKLDMFEFKKFKGKCTARLWHGPSLHNHFSQWPTVKGQLFSDALPPPRKNIVFNKKDGLTFYQLKLKFAVSRSSEIGKFR